MKKSKFYYLMHPRVSIQALFCKISDRYALEKLWKERMDYPLNLDNPRTFSEKLQWLKLHDRKPLYTTLVDKYKVKEWVANKIGTEYIIPTLGIYKHFNEIDLDALPNKFVLKCTHDSGSIVICEDKKTFNVEAVENHLETCLKRNFYYASREWPYKHVPRRIIAEPFMKDGENPSLTDYKFYCFQGVPKFLYVSYGLAVHSTAFINYMNLDWSIAPFHRPDFMEFEKIPPKPQSFDMMIKLATILSKDIPFVRVDFYEINHKPYFSELTFSPGDGLTAFEPPEWDYIIGDMLPLRD